MNYKQKKKKVRLRYIIPNKNDIMLKYNLICLLSVHQSVRKQIKPIVENIFADLSSVNREPKHVKLLFEQII